MSIRRILNIIKKVLNILNPRPAIGGLEIIDSALRFILVKETKLVSASLNLPAGIIEEGKIKNKENFKAALINLHSQITPRTNKKIYVIVNVPDGNIYSQVFNLPLVAIDNLEEAARLNLQMISPIEFASAYSDWQKVGENSVDGGQLEIMAAFAPSQVIDGLVECLKEANFMVAAVEFSGLSISRLSSGLSNINGFSLLMRVDRIGLNFNLTRNQSLYFSHFFPWPATEGQQMSFPVFKEIILRETQKVINFFNNHWPGVQLNNFLLIASALEEKISQIITENFSLPVQKLILPSKLSSPDNLWVVESKQLTELSPDWFNVLGSALRGLISRSDDIIISLASTGTEKEFQQQQIISVVKMWRNILISSLSFLLIVFALTESFLIKTVSSLNNQLSNLSNTSELGTLNNLQKEAKNLNIQIDTALQAQSQTNDWSPFLMVMKELTASAIVIERITAQSPEAPIFFSGQAVDEKAILDLKTKMEQNPVFSEVNLPLSSLTSAGNGSLTFNIIFKIKDLNAFIPKSGP